MTIKDLERDGNNKELDKVLVVLKIREQKIQEKSTGK